MATVRETGNQGKIGKRHMAHSENKPESTASPLSLVVKPFVRSREESYIVVLLQCHALIPRGLKIGISFVWQKLIRQILKI